MREEISKEMKEAEKHIYNPAGTFQATKPETLTQLLT
jgi:hypothetical protein